jgi:prepilin-type processing-associated H-X9-DG protein
MNALMSNETYDDPSGSGGNYYQLHKINEFKPYAAVFWEAAVTDFINTNQDPSNKPDAKPTVSMNRHATVKLGANGKVLSGGLATFGFLDGHAELWDVDTFRTAFTMPGLPLASSPLWVAPNPWPSVKYGGYNPAYTSGFDITPYIQLN